MISVTLEGRLGNQLFQYAFAINAARKLGVGFRIQVQHHPDVVAPNFDLPLFYVSKFDHNLFRLRGRFHAVSTVVENQEVFLRQINNHTIYNGYFQSEQYFQSHKEIIRQAFQLKQEWKDAFAENEAAFFDYSNSIVLHVRKGDFISWGREELGGTDLSLPASYYANALKELDWSENTNVIVVTEDPGSIKGFLPFLKKPIIISRSPFIDFQVMLKAERLVISNSTFAWWAAYLNNNKPLILAPEYWLGFKIKKEHPIGILPAVFRQISFD